MTGFGTQPDIRNLCRWVVGDTLILFLDDSFATPDQLFRLLRSLPTEELQRLGFQLVGGHEEFFQLFLDLGRQVLNALQLPLAVRIFGNGDDAIIADSVALGFLNRLKDADLASRNPNRSTSAECKRRPRPDPHASGSTV